jgi:Icc-related predicted phosphoesterase
MKIFVFSDLHCDTRRAGEIVGVEADFYVLCGDPSDVGDGLREMGNALKPLGQKLLVIPGNNETESQMEAWCRDFGFTSIHKKILKEGKYNFAGLGQSTFLPFSNPPNDLATPGEKGEAWFEKELEKFKGVKNLLLFCHQPPISKKLDLTNSGTHTGSKAIRTFILEEKPLYFFSGHIHNCAGNEEVIGSTKCYSPGKKGVLIELE